MLPTACFTSASTATVCAGAILSFVESHTVHIEGVGDVCSLAAFDFQVSLLGFGAKANIDLHPKRNRF